MINEIQTGIDPIQIHQRGIPASNQFQFGREVLLPRNQALVEFIHFVKVLLRQGVSQVEIEQ